MHEKYIQSQTLYISDREYAHRLKALPLNSTHNLLFTRISIRLNFFTVASMASFTESYCYIHMARHTLYKITMNVYCT